MPQLTLTSPEGLAFFCGLVACVAALGALLPKPTYKHSVPTQPAEHRGAPALTVYEGGRSNNHRPVE